LVGFSRHYLRNLKKASPFFFPLFCVVLIRFSPFLMFHVVASEFVSTFDIRTCLFVMSVHMSDCFSLRLSRTPQARAKAPQPAPRRAPLSVCDISTASEDAGSLLFQPGNDVESGYGLLVTMTDLLSHSAVGASSTFNTVHAQCRHASGRSFLSGSSPSPTPSVSPSPSESQSTPVEWR